MTGKDFDRFIGERLARVIETTLNELLDTQAFQSLKSHMKKVHKVDFTNYRELVLKPEHLEMALVSALGAGADLLLRAICDNLAKEFGLPGKEFRYRKAGDYVKLVYQIKSVAQ